MESAAGELTGAQWLWGWLLDYGYVTYWTVRGLVSKNTAGDLLTPPTPLPGVPILVIPGVYESWRFLEPIAEHLYREGHPVHVLDKLGYNTGTIPEMARLVTEYLEHLDLHDVVVVAHSKGGLIAKQALGQQSTLNRVRRLIAINSPFAGSRWAYLFPWPTVRVFTPTSVLIRQLRQSTTVNSRITSLYSVFDPHIPETSRLDGAENIILPTIGHFRPIGDIQTLELISTLVVRSTQ